MTQSTARPPRATATRAVVLQAAFIVGTLAAGSLIGSSFTPGAWYQGLAKPWFTPAPWVFGPVWTVLYILVGWAGARSLLYGGPIGLWALQMAVNLTWSPVFFGLQAPAAGLAVIVLLWASVLAFLLRAWPRERLSALLFVPYLVWVSLATAVNAGVAWLNP